MDRNKLTANEIVAKMIALEGDLDPDFRRVVMAERMKLQSALSTSGIPREEKAGIVARQMKEAVRVMDMYATVR